MIADTSNTWTDTSAPKLHKGKSKKAKLSKSAAAELKAQMEANQIGHGELPPVPDPTDTVTITPAGEEMLTKSEKKARKLEEKLKAAVAAAGETEPAEPKKGRKKDAQGDFVSNGKLFVPEPDSPLYKAGKRLADVITTLKDATDEKAEAELEVAKAMKNAKRLCYKVAGYTYELQHLGARDKIKVIKPK